MSRPEEPTHARHRLGGRQIVALVVAVLTLTFILRDTDTVQMAFLTIAVVAALWLALALGLLLVTGRK
jgi:uncharacterized integral membrane protein